MKIEPVTLEGNAVRWELMEDRHIDGLLAAADAPHIFDWISFAFRSREDIKRFVRRTSKAALRRIGAVEEGILRNHMIQPDGRRRHSVSYSWST
jgi:hypothetical protein